MHINGTLNPVLNDLIFFGVARSLLSPYCSEYHACNVLRLHSTLSYQDLVDIVEGNSHGILPDKYIVAVESVIGHTHSGCTLPNSEIDRLNAAGFSFSQIVEILGIGSLAQFLSSITMAGNIPIDECQKISGFYNKQGIQE